MLTVKNLGRYCIIKDDHGAYFAVKNTVTGKTYSLSGRHIIQEDGCQIINEGNKIIIQDNSGQTIIQNDRIISNSDDNISDFTSDILDNLDFLSSGKVYNATPQKTVTKTKQVTVNNSQSCSISNNVCKVNGKKYTFPNASNISIIGSDIYVDGKKVNKEEYEANKQSKTLVENKDTIDTSFTYDGHKLPYVPGRKICFAEDIIETKNAIYCYGYKLTPDGWKKSLVGKILQILRG